MVKFSFFTVRSKCCKKSKFVVFFSVFLSVGFEIFKFYIYCVYVFFSVCFYAVHSDYCCYPRLMFFFSSSVERSLFSSVYVCLFSFSFLPVSCLSTRPWPRTVSKNACANNPQQPTNRKKRFPGEGVTFLLFSFTFSFFHLEASERAHARRESVQRRSALASRRSIDEPTHEIANE